MQQNLALVNDLFKSKGSVANCMTDRASGHTENVTEQLLLCNGTLILVHTVKATSHSTIFDISMHLVSEDQRH